VQARDDILSLLLAGRDEDGSAMSDEALRDELKTLLLAGHETTAIALAWAFYWLHRQPDVYHRLHTELRALGRTPDPDDLVRLPYLGAVCDEALRLYPVVGAVTRRLRQPLTLRGYTLPAGIAVGVALPVVHSDPRLYPDPHCFRPERFLERTYTPFEYVPFGGGRAAVYRGGFRGLRDEDRARQPPGAASLQVGRRPPHHPCAPDLHARPERGRADDL
jgi:cytochrome P450 family 110